MIYLLSNSNHKLSVIYTLVFHLVSVRYRCVLVYIWYPPRWRKESTAIKPLQSLPVLYSFGWLLNHSVEFTVSIRVILRFFTPSLIRVSDSCHYFLIIDWLICWVADVSAQIQPAGALQRHLGGCEESQQPAGQPGRVHQGEGTRIPRRGNKRLMNPVLTELAFTLKSTQFYLLNFMRLARNYFIKSAYPIQWCLNVYTVQW